MAFELDVLVDVNAHGLEDRQLPGLQRQGLQGRCVEFGERTGAAAGQLLKRLGVELLQQRADGLVDVIDGGKLLVAQAHQDPALHHLHGRLDLALVLRVVRARRQHRGAVVAGKVLHGVVRPGLVAVGVGDQRAGIVRHDQQRHAADETQRLRRGSQPVGRGLARRGVGEGVARRAQGADEDVGAAAVRQGDRGAGVVDEQFLAGAVDLAHRALEAFGEAAVVLAELGVAVGGLPWVLADVLA